MMRTLLRLSRAVLLLMVVLWVPDVAANTVDFEGFEHGEVISDAGSGVTITVSNPTGPDQVVVFDSHEEGTADPDLQASGNAPFWSGGNLSNTDLGSFLIIQEHFCAGPICDDPDDEGSRNPYAGVIDLVFDEPIVTFGFDVVDVEDAVAEDGSVTLHGSQGSLTVSFLDFVTDDGNPFYDGTIDFGNNTANRIRQISAEGLGSVSRVEILMGGSGAIDNVVTLKIPEPGALAFVTLGLFGIRLFGTSRGRKRARA